MQDKITVRIPSELKQAIERFKNDQEVSFQSTQAACRHIIESWLTDNGYFVLQQAEQNNRLETQGEAL